AHSGEPAPRELIFTRDVIAESLTQALRLLAIMPDEFAAAEERVINRAAQRLPAYGRVRAVDAADEKIPRRRLQHDIARRGRLGIRNRVGAHRFRRRVVASGERKSQIEVGGFGDVAVSAQVSDGREVVARLLLEDDAGIAAIHLARRVDIQAADGGQYA